MQCLFIYNPHSGKGKILKHLDYVISELKEKFGNVSVLKTEYAGHAKHFCLEHASEYDYIVLSGGDGTLNEITNAIAGLESPPIIGYLPSGTVNDYARTLRLSSNIKKAVEIIKNGHVRTVDVFKAKDWYGNYVACCGIFTSSSHETNQNYKKKYGKLAYFFNGVKDFFHAKPIQMQIKAGEDSFSGYVAIMLLIHSASVAGFKINKTAKLDDGKIEVIVIKNKSSKSISFMNKLRVMKMFLFGIKRLKTNSHYLKTSFKNVTVNVPEDVIINIDGEKAFVGDFELEVVPKKLQIIVENN